MYDIIIRGARVLSPADGLDLTADIAVKDGKIAAVGALTGDAQETVDAKNLTAVPGLVDMHVHFRDPGLTHKEDIGSGSRAAAQGGFTAVACMPNTAPPVDSEEILRYIAGRSEGADCSIYPVACMTKAMRGEELCDFPALKKAGAVAVSDDGLPVADEALMERAVVEANRAGLLPISHCEDRAIVGNGIMNLGEVSEALGVPGIDRASEDSITAREIAIAERTGCKIHIAHVSTEGAVELIRSAKQRGVAVSCESAPHYFTFTDSMLYARDANFRMNPPLRTRRDVAAVIEGLRDGTIDAIATDHAPHSREEKADFLAAPNGIIGLESAFGAAATALVLPGIISLARLVELMSVNPARLLGIRGGTLAVGETADITLLDTEEDYLFSERDLAGKSANSPFFGMRLAGRPVLTVRRSKIFRRQA